MMYKIKGEIRLIFWGIFCKHFYWSLSQEGQWGKMSLTQPDDSPTKMYCARCGRHGI